MAEFTAVSRANFDTKIGTGTLTTTAQNVVGAVNEVVGKLIKTPSNANYRLYNIYPNQTYDGISSASLIQFLRAVTINSAKLENGAIVTFTCAGTLFADFPTSINPFGSGYVLGTAYYYTFYYSSDDGNFYTGRCRASYDTQWVVRKVAMTTVSY